MHVLLDPYPQGAPVIVFYHFLHLLEDLIPLYNILKVLTFQGNIFKINILDYFLLCFMVISCHLPEVESTIHLVSFIEVSRFQRILQFYLDSSNACSLSDLPCSRHDNALMTLKFLSFFIFSTNFEKKLENISMAKVQQLKLC